MREVDVLNEPFTAVVVDDEECIGRLVRRALMPYGWEVHEAREGRQGIETIMEVKPDLVILDIRIPVIQGFDVCRYVKEDPSTKAAKVLMISGLITEADRRLAIHCGADDTMQKPFSAAELSIRALDLMARRS
jgi:DNA-binding response OmpR family regulator